MMTFMEWILINAVVAAEATFIGFMAAFVWVMTRNKIKERYKKGE